MSYRLTLQAKQLPDGTRVTKPTGEKVYTLRRRIVVHADGRDPVIINAETGIRFLVSATGDSNAIPETAEVSITGTRRAIMEVLEALESNDEN